MNGGTSSLMASNSNSFMAPAGGGSMGRSGSSSSSGGGPLRSSRGGQQQRSRRSSHHHSNKKDFNPRLIFSQIVALQCFHYLILAFFVQMNHVLFHTSVTIDRIFTDQYFRLWSMGGWADNMAVVLSSLVGSILLAIIVEKSKKCLDFSVTLFLIHLMACIIYNGMPKTWDWWIIHIFATICMVLMGEYLCSRRELDDIPLLQL